MIMERYIVFDVETPNSRNHRMSSIGVSMVEGGRIVEEFGTLVNPQCPFDRFNIDLTGITPEMAAAAPAFPEVWQKLLPVFDSGILAAHNAPFDMGVLAKCLQGYGICWKPTAQYLCTCQMGRACFPQLPNHRLNTLCDHCGISLDHHRAESDSSAAAQLLIRYLDSGITPQRYLRKYDLAQIRTMGRR